MRIWKISHGKVRHFKDGLREQLLDRHVLSIGEPTNWGQAAGWQSDRFREIGRGNLVVLAHGLVRGSTPIRLCVVDSPVRRSAEFPNWLERRYLQVANSCNRTPYTGPRYRWTPNDNTTCWEVPQSDWRALERLILRPYFRLTLAEAIDRAREAVPAFPPDDPSSASREGRQRLALHQTRERAGTAAAQAKARALRKGTLRCEVCNFDFEAFYGPIGGEFIEAHHKVPLARLDPRKGGLTKVSDIALLCANCHRMVHHRMPCLTIRELRREIGGQLGTRRRWVLPQRSC